MIEKNYLTRTIAALLVISTLFALLSSLSIQFQFSLWELFIDARIVAGVAFFLIAWKRGWITISTEHFSFLRFDWRSNTVIFFLPALIYLLPVAVGLMTKGLTVNPPDNAATLVLGTFFDIPAIFVFSVTSVLIEEIIFRGILFRSIRSHFSLPAAFYGTNILWMFFCLSEIISIPEITVLKGAAIALFFFSIGVFCSALMLKNNSIWQAYSFRVGIVALTPILLTSFLAESDSFFTTDSLFFAADGILVSILILTVAFIIFRRIPVFDQNSGK